MLIYGASGHAKVIVSCLKAEGKRILAFFDDDPGKGQFLEFVVLNEYDPYYYPDERIVIGIGDNQIRKRISGLIKHPFGIVMHPSSVVAPDARIGEGTVIFHNSVIQSGTTIGKHVIINTKASVDHDCSVGDFTHFAPNTTLCGGITVGEGTLIGAGTTVIPNKTIGKWCVIAAGSVVTKDIPDYALVGGNPARVIKYFKN